MWTYIRNVMNKRKWAKWDSVPKDLVIFHTFGKAENIPSGSPFVLKLQTYLRMAKIPHKTDSKHQIGPKGKAPWISLNGVHMGDSELIIKYLNGYFNVNLNKGFTPSQIAIGSCVRITLEEHFLWGLALERFVFNPTQFPKVVGVSPLYDKALMTYGGYITKKRSLGQGMGRHSKAEIEDLCTRDLKAVSEIIGKNEFLLGKTPCQDDAAIFGMLAVVLWGMPNSPYEKLVRDDLLNLRDYCNRMKGIYFPDWEKCIRPSKSKGVPAAAAGKTDKDSANDPERMKAKL